MYATPERESDTWIVQLYRHLSSSVLHVLVKYPKDELEMSVQCQVEKTIGAGWRVTDMIPMSREKGLKWLNTRC